MSLGLFLIALATVLAAGFVTFTLVGAWIWKLTGRRDDPAALIVAAAIGIIPAIAAAGLTLMAWGL